MGHHVELRANANQRFTYAGRSLLVTDINGGISGTNSEGFYVETTRLLSREELLAGGRPLEAVISSPVDGDSFLAYCMVPKGPSVPEGKVYVEIARFVGDGMRTVLRIENYAAQATARFDLGLRLEADFADLVEARGLAGESRQQTAPVETSWDEDRWELWFRYRHPHLDRAVAIHIERSPVLPRHVDHTILFPLELPPHQPIEIRISVEPVFDGVRRAVPRQTFDRTDSSYDRLRRHLQGGAPALSTSNAAVARAWQTAINDLATFPLDLEGGPAAPAAGIPLYQHFLGRDTLTISWHTLLAMPALMRDSLRLNAAMQGKTIDDWLDEEPGKMIHEARPWAALRPRDRPADPELRGLRDAARFPDYAWPVSCLDQRHPDRPGPFARRPAGH